MNTLIKTAIAVVCLFGVGVLIVVDRWNSREATPPAPAAAPAPVIAPVPPLALPIEPVRAPEEKKVVELPKPAPAPVVPVPAKPSPLVVLPSGERVYTIVQGDTLYGISIKVYNTPRHYERIYEANRERIADPNTLRIGMKLVMPELPAETPETAKSSE